MTTVSNAQKTPFARSINRFAENKVQTALQLQGKNLPCQVQAISGGIVTVSFQLTSNYTLPNVTCPMAGSEYVRLPVQAGCKGFVVSADAYLGGMSGLGGGTADLAIRGNLSSLVFVPITNKGWDDSENPNAIVLYGPDGGVLRTADKSASLTVDSAHGAVLKVPAGKTLVITSLPTSPAGLGAGALWNDGGTVKVA